MLTINGQASGQFVLVFVADEDGETIFETTAGMTLDAICESESMSSKTIDWSKSKSLAECVDFCGNRDYWISPALKEAFEQASKHVTYKFAFSN